MSYFNIRKIDAIDSTNEALKKQYQRGEIHHGELLWAKDQTKGKGQRVAKWYSQAGKNLTFSFFLSHEISPFDSPFHLNCLIALGVKNVLSRLEIPQISVKWPNDILSVNKKIGGILIENSYRGSKWIGSIIGIGLNVNQDEFKNIPRASSFYLQSNKHYDLTEILNLLLKEFEESLLLAKKYQEVLDEFNASLYGYQTEQNFRIGKIIFPAKIKGVNYRGMLVLQNENEETKTYGLKEIELIY